MSKVRVEGHLLQDHSVLVCSGESADDVSWARDEATGQVFVVLEHIAHEDVIAVEEQEPRGAEPARYFGLRLYGGAAALPSVGRVLEVA
ncbi:MAG: hypothetical protein ABIQ16_05280 [Polyangiaceae bacterium]